MTELGLCRGARRRLREALLVMLEDTELDQICVTELCRRAEVNRTSFYRYYSLPEDVLSELLEDLAAALAKVTELPRDSGKMEDALQVMCRELYARAPLVRTLIRRSEEGGSDREFRNLLAKGMADSVYGGKEPEHRSLAAAFFAGGLWAVLRSWLKEETPCSPEEMAVRMLELVKMGRGFQ